MKNEYVELEAAAAIVTVNEYAYRLGTEYAAQRIGEYLEGDSYPAKISQDEGWEQADFNKVEAIYGKYPALDAERHYLQGYNDNVSDSVIDEDSGMRRIKTASDC